MTSPSQMGLLATFVLAIRDDASYATTERLMLRFFPDPSERARLLNGSDPEMGITPLMVLAGRDRDDDETIRIAQLLLDHGAGINVRQIRAKSGCTPLIMAAQNGYPNLLKFMIAKGAEIDVTPLVSQTQAISFAVQNYYPDCPKCVAILAQEALNQHKEHILEAPSSRNHRTPAYIAVERGFPSSLGALAKAGADLRRACPIYFILQEDRESLVDPLPDSNCPVQYATNRTVRSFVGLECAECGHAADEEDDATTSLKSCSCCHMAYYCSVDCQKKNWSLHKKCCKLLRQGQDRVVGGSGDDAPGNKFPPLPASQVYGFAEPFTAADTDEDDEEASEYYNPETHPVWEYNAGRRGKPDWRRYPPKIERGITVHSSVSSNTCIPDLV